MSSTYKNIFSVVADSDEERCDLTLRADLIIVLRDIINDNGWSQTLAANKLGLTQENTQDLINGKIEEFPVSRLIACLTTLGYRFKPRYVNGVLSIDVQAAC